MRKPQLKNSSGTTGDADGNDARPRAGQNEQIRAKILRAADATYRRYGLRRTSMDDVAEAAGVSRATVYNYFTNKRELVAAIAASEETRVLRRAIKQLDLDLPSDELIVEATLLRLKLGRNSPYANLLMAPDAADLRSAVFRHSDLLIAGRLAYWEPIFDVIRGRDELRAGLDVVEAAQWLDLANVMLAATSDDTDWDMNRRLLKNYVTPALLKV